MPVTIADLWLIKRVDQPVDIRSPIYGSRQIDREVARANEECRGGYADWIAVSLEDVMQVYVAAGSKVCW